MVYRVLGLTFDADALQQSDGVALLVPRLETTTSTYVPHLLARVVAFDLSAKEGDDFEAAVESERRSLVNSLPRSQMVERTTLSLAGRPAQMFTHTGESADGLPIRHHQALIAGEGAMVVLSAVGFERNFVELRDAFEALLAAIVD